MATGPEHTAEAQRLLARVTKPSGDIAAGDGAVSTLLAALTHAVLALGGDLDDWQPQTPPQPTVRPVETLPGLPDPAQGGA